MIVYKERYEKKDDGTLRDFFGHAEHGRQYLHLIADFETDKFKPLDNYLKGDTERTNNKNLELLAWLINFKHRPFSFGMEVLLSDEELAIINTPINNDPGEKRSLPESGEDSLKNKRGETERLKNGAGEITEANESKKEDSILKTISPKQTSNKKSVLFLLISIICIGAIYFIWQQQQDKQNIMGITNTSCMYWAQDHFEPAPCNEKGKGFLFPLDEEKVKNFKKITRRDTITEWSIGKLYYIKNDKDIDCYTEDGYYPEEPDRKLNVLTRHMYNKYLGNKKLPARDSLNEQNTNLTGNR